MGVTVQAEAKTVTKLAQIRLHGAQNSNGGGGYQLHTYPSAYLYIFTYVHQV